MPNHSQFRGKLREKIFTDCGVVSTATDVPLSELFYTEWCDDFIQFMKNRLVMGALRYGAFNSSEKGGYDCIKSIIDKARLYDKTGNDELLVDIANLALVEYIKGTHPKKHFAATDDTHHTPRI